MRYLSLFSGIEAVSVAWAQLGWECVAVAEINPAPSLLLANRFPGIPNLGDVTKITDQQIASLGKIDLVVGGSPCQDLSIAGKRRGLNGARSGLFYEQIRIFHATRKFCGARFLLWENVVGALSGNKGRDFARVVEEMAGLEHIDVPKFGWGTEGAAVGDHGLLEWGCLDAQWFGVPQRRRRIFAFLDTGNWTDRQPVLLEPDSVRGHPPSREKTGQIVAAITANGVGASGADDNQAQAGHLIVCPRVTAPCIAFTCKDFGQDALIDQSPTLRAMGHDTSHANGGGQIAIVISINDKATRCGSGGASRPQNDGCGNGLGVEAHRDPCPTLDTASRHAVFVAAFAENSRSEIRYEGGDGTTTGCLSSDGGKPGQGYPAIAIFQPHDEPNSNTPSNMDVLALPERMTDTQHAATINISPSLQATNPTAIAFNLLGREGGSQPEISDTASLRAADGGSSRSYLAVDKGSGASVRRLTPTECERLQGFPDEWTKIPIKIVDKPPTKQFEKYPEMFERNKDGTWTKFMPDGPRYKMIGNSMATPVMLWIGMKIERAVSKNN